MIIEEGAVVRSLAGRDKGRLMVVVKIEAQRCLVCDGKERPLERPKRKNLIHLSDVGLRLSQDSMVTNREIRKSLRRLTDAAAKHEEVI